MPNVTNVTNAVGFVDLNDLYGDEIVTTVNPSLLQDAAKAAEVLDDSGGYNKVQVHLVEDGDGGNPAIALSTNRSRPMAAMVASVLHPEEDANDDA